MNHMFRTSCLLTLGLIVAFVPIARGQDGKTKDEIHVLFIGNSFTYYHDLPKMIAELAKAGKQPTLHHDRETPGGCTLEKHWKDGKALTKLQSRKWDIIVLQDQSQAPLLKQDSMFEYGRKFDAAAKKQNARTLLYLTWAMQNKPDDQPTISRAYLNLAKELKSEVAPVGIAWDAALKADRNLSLHEKDKKHPNPKGTYLAACVFYAAIYGKSPEGLPGTFAKLSADETRSLQVAAWKATQETRISSYK